MNTELNGGTKGVDLKWKKVLDWIEKQLQKYTRDFTGSFAATTNPMLYALIMHSCQSTTDSFTESSYLWGANSFHYSLQKLGICSFGDQFHNDVKTG